jgi:hypothetical protein
VLAADWCCIWMMCMCCNAVVDWPVVHREVGECVARGGRSVHAGWPEPRDAGAEAPGGNGRPFRCDQPRWSQTAVLFGESDRDDRAFAEVEVVLWKCVLPYLDLLKSLFAECSLSMAAGL